MKRSEVTVGSVARWDKGGGQSSWRNYKYAHIMGPAEKIEVQYRPHDASWRGLQTAEIWAFPCVHDKGLSTTGMGEYDLPNKCQRTLRLIDGEQVFYLEARAMIDCRTREEWIESNKAASRASRERSARIESWRKMFARVTGGDRYLFQRPGYSAQVGTEAIQINIRDQALAEDVLAYLKEQQP